MSNDCPKYRHCKWPAKSTFSGKLYREGNFMECCKVRSQIDEILESNLYKRLTKKKKEE